MEEINFVQLINNTLAVVATHRDHLFRTRLSIITPLSDNLKKCTHPPIFGPRGSSYAPSSIRVFRNFQRDLEAAHQRGIGVNNVEIRWSMESLFPERIAIRGPKPFKIELELLQEFQNLHHLLRVSKLVTSSQIPSLMTALSKLPVLSVAGLAHEANVSQATAKRWLRSLLSVGQLRVRDNNGMKQYAYAALVEILDNYVRYSAKP